MSVNREPVQPIAVAGSMLGDRRLLDLLSEAVTWSKRRAPGGGVGGIGLSAGPAPIGDRPVHAHDFTNWEAMLARPVALAGESGVDLAAERLVGMLRDWTDPALLAHSHPSMGAAA